MCFEALLFWLEDLDGAEYKGVWLKSLEMNIGIMKFLNLRGLWKEDFVHQKKAKMSHPGQRSTLNTFALSISFTSSCRSKDYMLTRASCYSWIGAYRFPRIIDCMQLADCAFYTWKRSHLHLYQAKNLSRCLNNRRDFAWYTWASTRYMKRQWGIYKLFDPVKLPK